MHDDFFFYCIGFTLFGGDLVWWLLVLSIDPFNLNVAMGGGALPPPPTGHFHTKLKLIVQPHFLCL